MDRRIKEKGWKWTKETEYPGESKESVIGRKIEQYNNKSKLLGMEVQLMIVNDKGRATIRTARGDIEELIIPSFVEEIQMNAFNAHSKIKRIRGENIVYVGQFAFYESESLIEVDFPIVEVIDRYAFNGCTNLEKFEGTNPNMQCVGENGMAFTKIQSIDFENAHSIGEGAFAGCNELTDVNLPYALIEPEAFMECKGLKKVNAGRIYRLSVQVFKNCINLEELTVPRAEIKERMALDGCVKLKAENIHSAKELVEELVETGTGRYVRSID